ncbi:MAG TPA: S8 family serine peptidase [Kineosporiaceae bacterium]|nr:S8 family serine peptidase [Kineosporiaceae bacterium]
MGAAAGVLGVVVLVAGAGAVALAGPGPEGPAAGPAAGAQATRDRGAISAQAPSRTTASPGRFPSAATSTAAVARIRPAAPVVPRGPSTRIAPRLVAARVKAGQSVRISAVAISGDGARVTVVRRTGPEAASAAIAAAQADPTVVAVQVDQRVHILDDAPDTSSASTSSASVSSGSVTARGALSNDADRSSQWALDTLRAEQAWDVTRGAGQVVAVVDSGVQGDHPDLAGQVLTGIDYITPGGGNGWNDGRGHGTHVAGIIAALAGNGIGTAGLAPAAKILPVRALDASGGGWDGDIASGVIWAAEHGATVINLSVGGTENSDAVNKAINYAVGLGAVVLAAGGNECQTGDAADYPAAFNLPGELAVAATTSSGVAAAYSNTGSYVQVAAPGDGILSTYPGGGYAWMSGTSMATPYVAASVALVRAADPALTPVATTQLLMSTADDLGTPGRDSDSGAGLVDPVAALCSVNHCPPGVAPSSAPSSGASSLTVASSSRPALVTGMTATVNAPASPTVLGRAAQLAVHVTDGRCAVAGAAVTVKTSDRSARGTTASDGMARIRVAPVRSAGWAVSVTAPGHATGNNAWAMAVVPVVSMKWAAGRVNVTVAPLLHQTVSFFELTAGRWVLRRKAVVGSGSSGTITLVVKRTGRARVVVSAAGGLAGVTVEHG